MNCSKCNNIINKDSKFCGKCGNKIEQEKLTTEIAKEKINDFDQIKIINDIKNTGLILLICGFLPILALTFILIFKFSYFNQIGYLVTILALIIGILFILSGFYIKNKVDTRAKTYLKIIYFYLIFVLIFNFISGVIIGAIENSHYYPGISFFIILSLIGMVHSSLKKIKKMEKLQLATKLKKQYILLFIVISVIFIILGLLLDSKKTMNDSPGLLSVDKSSEYSEITENMYRNTKYHFRIKFPDGWAIEDGDGIHVIKKADSEDGTISLIIQQFDLGKNEGFSSIRDAGSVKEFIDTGMEEIKLKFSDAKMIDYGETKIDNEPAYWIEYSATYKVLDYEIEMTNITYFLAKNDIMYSISSGTETSKYSEIKPIFNQSVSTFVLETY